MSNSCPPTLREGNDGRIRRDLEPDANRAIWIIIVSAFIVVLNETLMGVSLPGIMIALGVTATTGHWLTSGYLLTMSVVIPFTGALIRRYETRSIYLTAMSIFLVGTLVSALAPQFFLLLTGRIIQATGTALILPLLTTTVATVVPYVMRGSVMGRVSVVMAAAPALGPPVSGLILHFLNWRWIFILMLPIAAAVMVVGYKRLPNVGTRHSSSIDFVSAVLSVGGFCGLVGGLSLFGKAERDSLTLPVSLLAVGAVLLGGLVLRQLRLQKQERAFLDLRVFRSRSYTLALLVLTTCMVALYGTLVLLPITMQWVLGIDTLATGLLLLPGGLLMAALGPMVGKLVDRLGIRPILVPGVLLVLVGITSLSTLTVNSPAWAALAGYTTLYVGLAATYTPVFTAAFATIPQPLISHGSAILSTLQHISGAVGTALFITIMSTVATAENPLGANDPLAVAAGSSVAFLVGGAIAAAAVVFVLLIRPRDTMQPRSVDLRAPHPPGVQD